MKEWILTEPINLMGVVVCTVGIYLLLIGLTRLAGLRAFSKLSSFDFAVTIAMGSVIATTISAKSPPLAQCGLALIGLFAIQFIVAFLRSRTGWMSLIVDNRPLLLMDGTEVLTDNLRRARITRDDLRGKLREANVLDLSQVRAVVLEATGDISVLHGDADGPPLSDELLEGVRGRSKS